MSVNRNLFKKKKKHFFKIAGKKKASIVSHVGDLSQMSSPVKRLRRVQPYLSPDCSSKKAPGKTSPAQMNHSTELEDIMTNYFKVLNLWLFRKQQ